jgi:WD40 repeat protein
VQLFLSTVSDEFRSYRDHLRDALDRLDVTVKVQENFIVSGTPTLEMLDDYIRHCDGVIHLVGDMTGSLAKPQSLAAIRERYPDLAEKLKPIAECLCPGGPSLSYTQWEAWLALLHGKKLFIATPDAVVPRDGKYVCDPAQIQAQQDHLARLRAMERYPGVTFTSGDHLASNLLRSFILDGLVEARLELLRPPSNASGWTWPGAWPFSGYLREKRKGFIGRRWLFDVVRAWYGDPAASQALRIEADYGVGKTAFMAELAATGTAEQGLPIAAYHFCERSTAPTLEAATFVRSVAAQLAGALPAYQAAVEDDPEAQRWLDEAQKDPISAFSHAVICKLDGIAAPATPLLLLIDGLDETLDRPSSHASGNGGSIVDLLANTTATLPIWLKVLATSRRRQEVRQPLEATYACDVLNAEEARNLSDIREYVLGRCAVEPLAGQLAQDGRSPEDLAAQLASPEQKRSGGKFLYAVRVLTALANGRLTADQVDALPPGMDGFYLDAFKRRFPTPAHYAAMRQLLGVLCVQREPFTRQALAAILGVKQSEVRDQLSSIEDFLRIAKASTGPATAPGKAELTYSFDHFSLAQWLTEEDDYGNPRAGKVYAVEQEAAAELIRAWARDEFAAGRAHEWPYLTHHLAEHLETIERQEAYSTLLLDLRWLHARLLWADPNALLSDWQWSAPTPELTVVERVLRQGAHVVSHQGMGWNGLEQLPSQLLARLPIGNPPGAALHESPSLREQAIAQLQKAGSPCPLTASLLAPEALIRTLHAQSSGFNTLTMLPDGRLASGGDDGTICLWDPVSGSSTARFPSEQGRVRALAALTDGRLASGGDDGTIRLWDPVSCVCTIINIRQASDSVNTLAVLPDGSLAWGTDRGAIGIWDPIIETKASDLWVHSGPVLTLAVLPDGRLASGAADAASIRLCDPDLIRLWISDPEKISENIDIECSFPSFNDDSWCPVRALTVLPDGRLASGGDDGIIKLWDTFSRTCTSTFQTEQGPLWALAVLPDGRLASAGHDGSICLWDRSSSACSTIFKGHSAPLRTLAVLGDGHLASGGDDNTIKLWNYPSKCYSSQFDGHSGAVLSLAVLRDGRIASVGIDKIIRLWDLTNITCIRSFKSDDIGIVKALQVTTDGRLALGGLETYDGTISLWDPDTSALIAFSGNHPGGIYAFTMLSDGRLVSGGPGIDQGLFSFKEPIAGRFMREIHGPIMLWDPATGDGSNFFENDYHCEVTALASLHDGRLASGGDDGTISIWDLASCTSTTSFKMDNLHTVNVLTVLPDGRLVSGGSDGTIMLWDPGRGAPDASLEGHSGQVAGLAALPDGRLASVGEDRTIRIWECHNGSWSGSVVFVADDEIYALALVPGPAVLVAGDASGRLHWLQLAGT